MQLGDKKNPYRVDFFFSPILFYFVLLCFSYLVDSSAFTCPFLQLKSDCLLTCLPRTFSSIFWKWNPSWKGLTHSETTDSPFNSW